MSPTHAIDHWTPEDEAFWQRTGHAVAGRNLALSVLALMVAFAVWMLWSVLAVHLPAAGFRYSSNQLFWLAALPALCGATLRIFYAFAVPVFGGRRFTGWATASLLLPVLGTGLAVQNPATPYEVMVALALLCGLGGANFASSMAHISHFYPRARLGYALGMNAGLGQLGISLVQVVVPLVIGVALFGSFGGQAQGSGAAPIWLQNAAFVWVPLIVVSALAVFLGMNDLSEVRGGFGEQAVIFKRKHNWLMCWLYLGSFGSFIGFAAGLPLLATSQFPDAGALHVVWVGPLLGALVRPVGGWLSDRLGGARVTFWVFIGMTVGVVAVLQSLPTAGSGGHYEAFVGAFMALFVLAGIGSGSTFRMIPVIFLAERQRKAADDTAQARAKALRDGHQEAAGVLGFSSAVGAYGGFFIPKLYGTSIAMTGGVQAALHTFIVFYATCVAVTWWHYSRKNAPMPC